MMIATAIVITIVHNHRAHSGMIRILTTI